MKVPRRKPVSGILQPRIVVNNYEMFCDPTLEETPEEEDKKNSVPKSIQKKSFVGIDGYLFKKSLYEECARYIDAGHWRLRNCSWALF